MLYLILICMLFTHIVDDFYLQGILASMKQKKWWEKNAPDKLYKDDYKVALFMHACSWSFMMMLPIVLYRLSNGALNINLTIIMYFVNVVVHAVVDHFKANKGMINLIQDQCCHIEQIVITWAMIGVL